MKLNIGCGEFPLKGFINLDAIPRTYVDVIADLYYGLPFKDNSFDVVYAGHVIEHLLYESALNLLSEIYRVLKPGGLTYIVIPDILKMYSQMDRATFAEAVCIGIPNTPFVEWYKSKDKTKEAVKLLHGVHKTAWTAERLYECVKALPFREVSIEPPIRSRCPYLVAEAPWQSVVFARK
ncbi:MAG: methyltransferase domain-containing protein [Candidatus Aenigmatarchaeota archaeon]